MNGWTVFRIVFQALAAMMLVGSIGVSVYSVYSPAWQTVNITEEYKYHEHGLWRDCVTNTRAARMLLTDRETHYCDYKFNQPTEEESEHDPQDGHNHGPDTPILVGNTVYQHMNLRFHRIVLGLTIAACVIGFISLLVSFCSLCFKAASIVWTILNLIAAILSATGLIIFFRYSHDKDYRFIYKAERKYEQELGMAFWLAMGGCLGFLAATILGMLGTVSHFLADRRSEQYQQQKMIWPKGVTSSAV